MREQALFCCRALHGENTSPSWLYCLWSEGLTDSLRLLSFVVTIQGIFVYNGWESVRNPMRQRVDSLHGRILKSQRIRVMDGVEVNAVIALAID